MNAGMQSSLLGGHSNASPAHSIGIHGMKPSTVIHGSIYIEREERERETTKDLSLKTEKEEGKVGPSGGGGERLLPTTTMGGSK